MTGDGVVAGDVVVVTFGLVVAVVLPPHIPSTHDFPPQSNGGPAWHLKLR